MEKRNLKPFLIVAISLLLIFPAVGFCEDTSGKVTFAEPRQDGGILFGLESMSVCTFIIDARLPENVRNQYLGILLMAIVSPNHCVFIRYYTKACHCGTCGMIGLDGDSYMTFSKTCQ